MKLKDLLVEAGTGVKYLVFGPSATSYHLVINFNKAISDKDKDEAHKAIKEAIENGFGALIRGILSSYDSCHSSNEKDAEEYRQEFKEAGKTLKSALETAIKAGDIPGIDKETKVSKIEHPL